MRILWLIFVINGLWGCYISWCVEREEETKAMEKKTIYQYINSQCESFTNLQILSLLLLLAVNGVLCMFSRLVLFVYAFFTQLVIFKTTFRL